MSDDPTLHRRTLLTSALVGAIAPQFVGTTAMGATSTPYRPVIVPNGAKIPTRLVKGVKVSHLVVHEVEHEFAPGLRATCWGYNGHVNGPVFEWVEGDRVRIYVTNRLTAPTTVHWHGLLLPSGMDGVGGLSQPAIQPGETFRYEFELKQHGTFMFHSHHDEMTQMAMGLTGMIVVHPRVPTSPQPDRDFVLMLHEWRLDVGARRPNPNEMTDFNVLTLNGKCFPGTAPLTVTQGERVRIRLGNLSAMDHHPIHLHGHALQVTETDGGVIPPSARWPETTVLVPVGSTRTAEFTAHTAGDWALHCHMTHHVMNQMGHGLPNLIGVQPGAMDSQVREVLPGYMTMGQHGMGDMSDMGMAVPANSIPMQGGVGPHGGITMGGMFTILKVRPKGQVGTEWYAEKPESIARVATSSELTGDGVDVDQAPQFERSPL